jgi:hypothetical protein
LFFAILSEVQIEAAYDLLLMQNMKARFSGEMNVKNSVRFADVPTKRSVKQVRLLVSYLRQHVSASELPVKPFKIFLTQRPNAQLLEASFVSWSCGQ